MGEPIAWCDPPRRRPKVKRTHAEAMRDCRVWEPRLEPLVAEPGRWALVWDYSTHAQAVSIVRELRRAASGRRPRPVLPPGVWEFEQHALDGRWGVWARYLGPKDAP